MTDKITSVKSDDSVDPKSIKTAWMKIENDNPVKRIFISGDETDDVSFRMATDDIIEQANDILNLDRQKATQINIKFEIELLGETFHYDFIEDGILISHPVWSLTGFGENLYEAERNLHENIRDIAEEFINESDSNLTIEAINFKTFLLNNM